VHPIQTTFTPDFDPQSLSIFVTGVCGRALGSGHFNATDLDELVREAKAAFLKHMAQQPAQRPSSAPEPEFNDPLPSLDQYGVPQPVDIDDDWQQ